MGKIFSEELVLEKDKIVIHRDQILRALKVPEGESDPYVDQLIDEFTGRVLPGRRYSDGLHQAIEAKENVKVQRDYYKAMSRVMQMKNASR